MFGTFLASEVRLLRRMLEHRGVDADAVLRGVRLDPALVEKSRARYPTDRVAEAWSRSVELTGDADFGLSAAEFYRPTDFHGLAVVFLASSDLGTALARLARYHAVVNTAVKMRVSTGDGRIELHCLTPGASSLRRRVMEDTRAAVLVDLCRNGVADPLDPLEIHYTSPRPASIVAHEKMFRCRMVFDAEDWRLVFRASDAERPFQASNRELAQSNDHVLESVLQSLRQDDLVSRVKRAMVDELPSGTPSENRIAKAVSLSARSLQRRLAEQRTSFSDLLAAVRRELAERYVLDHGLPVTEISYMLGFSDLSSFSRAFKRWTGRSPAEARRSLPRN